MVNNDYKWMVFVRCSTFNQAPYIVDAMNGFTMQQTSYPYVCCIVDDASTDGEQEVIKSYLNEYFDLEDKNVVRHEETDDYVLTFARHKTNKNCYFAVLYLKYNHYRKKSKAPYLAQWREKAKYIAICEGDDYWIVEDKLQKQVNYLESHSDYVLVHSDFTRVHGKGKRIKHNGSRNYKTHEGNVTNTLFNGCWIRTPTVCYRNIDYTLDVKYPQGMFKGDIFLFFLLSLKGKFHFMDEETCVYRIVENSASHQISEEGRWKFKESVKILDYFMADHLKVESIIKSKLDNKWFLEDFRHSILALDYSYYKMITVPHKLECPQKIQLQYKMAKIKPVFYLMSYRIKLIRFLKTIVRRFINH